MDAGVLVRGRVGRCQSNLPERDQRLSFELECNLRDIILESERGLSALQNHIPKITLKPD